MKLTSSLGFLMLSACSSSVQPGARSELGVFAETDAGAADPAAGSGNVLVTRSTVAPGSDELTARITAPTGLTLEIVTLACAGDCADVVAEAHGGHPPYHFQWEDGSTSATRQVCPTASGELKLEVTDTAIDNAEFGYVAQTARASVTSQVLNCSSNTADPDAGSHDSGADAATAASDPSWCQPQTVSIDAAASCLTLTARSCATPANPGSDGAVYESPIPLVPGHHSCLVAFGTINWSVSPLLHLWASHTDFESTCNGTDDSVLSNGELPNPGDTDGRVLCLSDPKVSSTKFYVQVAGSLSTAPDLSALDLRICETCPL